MNHPDTGLTYAQLASLKPGHWVILAHPSPAIPTGHPPVGTAMCVQEVHERLTGVISGGQMRWFLPWELELPTREELARIQLEGLGGL